MGTKTPFGTVKGTRGIAHTSTVQLEAIIQDTGVVPAVNQIERHPRIPDPRLLDYCARKQIITTAYSAFGNNPFGLPLLVNAPEVKAVADRLSKAQGKTVTPAQVILAWCTRGNHTVIPKSVTPSRIRENFVDVDIDDEAFNAIEELGKSPQRFNVPYTSKWLLCLGKSVTMSESIKVDSVGLADKPRWNINIFGDEKEKDAVNKVVLKL